MLDGGEMGDAGAETLGGNSEPTSTIAESATAMESRCGARFSEAPRKQKRTNYETHERPPKWGQRC